MIIHFIGPGGAGKTTTANKLSLRLGVKYYDLDEYFMLMEGDISTFIRKYSYRGYAIRNIQLYLQLKDLLNINNLSVVVCSSGFMTYPIDIYCNYKNIKQEIEFSPFTFLLLPSLELEGCVEEIVRRQVKREYLNNSAKREEEKIRNRFPIYFNLKCKKILTNDDTSNIVYKIHRQLFQLLK